MKLIRNCWDSIKRLPTFCVSQTMANGMIGTYEEMTAGKVSTVENLVKLFHIGKAVNVKSNNMLMLTRQSIYLMLLIMLKI